MMQLSEQLERRKVKSIKQRKANQMMNMKQFEKLSKEEQKALIETATQVQAGVGRDDEGLKSLSMDQFEGKIAEMFAKHIGSMTSVDKKYFQLPGVGTDLADNITPEAKFTKTVRFMKSMISGDIATVRNISAEASVKANLSEGTATAGGYLVPEEFAAEILRLAPEYGVARREARRIPMMSDVINIPAAGATGQSAIWTNEAAQIKQTNPDYRQVVLTINKLAAIPKVTSELLADANVDTIQYLAMLISEAFAAEEDEQAFNGSGSPFVGVLQATGVPESAQVGGTAAQSLSYTDLVTTTGNLYSNALGNAKFYFNRTMIAHMQGLITTTGAPLFPSGAGKNLLGFPLVGVEKLPVKTNAVGSGTAYAIFGDLRRGLLMGERGSITMKISDQATVDSDNLFEKDMVALRMIERVCFGVALPSSFTRIVTG